MKFDAFTSQQLAAIDRSCRNELDPSILSDVFILADRLPEDRATFVDVIIEQASTFSTLADRLACMKLNHPTYTRRLTSHLCDLEHECFVFHYGN